MTWPEIRTTCPRQWVLVEALDARTENGQRVLERIAVVDRFDDPNSAWEDLSSIRARAPRRELYVLHTSRDQPDVRDTGRIRLGPK